MKSAAAAPPRSRARRVDFASLAVLPAGIAIVLLAQMMEGGMARSLLQGPAALIVFGGTLAALLISYSPTEVVRAIRTAAGTFVVTEENARELSSRFVGYAIKAHRKGLLALDDDVEQVEEPFLRHGLSLVVDGVSLPQLQDVLTAARSAADADEDRPVRIFEAAAGYAPTLGILGAVLGLIQVMEHLGQPGALGTGIAVAFVATVYGVGAANLLFLPIAARLRERSTAADLERELMGEGLCALQQRVHPRVMAHRLQPFMKERRQAARIGPRAAAAESPSARSVSA